MKDSERCGQHKKQMSWYHTHRKTPSNTEKTVGVSYLELRGYRSHGELTDRHATLTPCLNLAQEHFGGRKYQTVQKALFKKLE